MIIKTAELTDGLLDWAVSKCQWFDENGNWEGRLMARYSTYWSYGGPVIENHPMQVGRAADRDGFAAYSQNGVNCVQYGDTMLIAAMRCYVASKLGDEVDVPDELDELLSNTNLSAAALTHP